MPQLDKLSFLNQLIWFFSFFFIFYFLMIKTFLPTIGRSLKLRHRLLNLSIGLKSSKNNTFETTVIAGSKIVNIINNLLQTILVDKTFTKTVENSLQLQETFKEAQKLYVDESFKLKLKNKFLTK